MNRFALVLTVGCFIGSPLCLADVVHLSDGRTLTGIAEDHDDDVIVHTKGGSITVERANITSIDKTAVVQDVSRLPKWEQLMAPTSTADWAQEIRQIPATVIDKGIMRNVPYMSYKAGDYEINLYGDPENPAGIEIGVRNALLQSEAAKNNCLQFIKAVLPLPQQQAVIESLNHKKDSKELNGLVYEITPQTDPDAYDGWWISVYNVKALDTTRATEAEMAKIAVQRETIEANYAQAQAAEKAGED